ncbi:MAG TPA: HAD hydrolase family protein [Patescibacteria group bacterium]|nr:HAD hydrolase family protein [Patescibacteria group bacterium]
MNCFIFDLDGVITNPVEKKVTQPELFTFFKRILDNGDVLTINTGRQIPWIEQRVIKPFEKTLSPEETHHIFISAEKGAVWQEQGKDFIVDTSCSIPKEIQEQTEKLVVDEFSDCMFYDSGKQTMMSIEMLDGTDIALYHQRREDFVRAVKKILENAGITNLSIDKTNISTDIENKGVGKDLGIQRILTWLDEKNNDISHFYCFGDSPSDIAMGDKLYAENKPFTYIFTGQPERLSEVNIDFPLTQTQALFDKGTVEYLHSLLA